jgi:hypothetical protein
MIPGTVVSTATRLQSNGLQFYEDGRKIAPYANTLPGSFFLWEEVVL